MIERPHSQLRTLYNMTAVPLGGPSTGIPPVGVEGVDIGNSAFMRVSERAKVNFHPCQRPPTDTDAQRPYNPYDC